MDKFFRQSIIRAGYNRLAATYAGERKHLKSGKYIEMFTRLLPAGASVLDIGCGDGLPVATTLTKKGCLVTGIDVAESMIVQARKNCPRGAFIIRDMESLKPGEFQVQAVVSLYALFHVPRDAHARMFQVINSFLPAKGYALITMGDREFEGIHQAYGVTMWSSHWGREKNRQLATHAGFRILTDELATSGGERHQILLLEKQMNENQQHKTQSQ